MREQKTARTAIQATPSSIQFGKVISGVSYSQSVRLSNTGSTDVQITQAATSGAGISVSGLSLPITLQAGQSATFTAAVLSSTSGGIFGGITVVGNGGDAGTTIGMTATVVPSQSQLTASVSSVNFGNELVGNAATQNVTLTNTGNTDITISTVAASGSGFTVAGGIFGVKLSPGQQSGLAVTFDPTIAGTTTGTIVVTSDATPLQIGLSGTGINTPSQHSVALNWTPSTTAVTGYLVYRGKGLDGPLSRLSASVVSATTFTDTTVASGQSYNYAVTSVGNDNIESTYSNQTAVTIPGRLVSGRTHPRSARFGRVSTSRSAENYGC